MLARLWNAKPKMPLTPPLSKPEVACSTARRVCEETVYPARETLSVARTPSTSPEPYEIVTCWEDEEVVAVYCGEEEGQEVHLDDASQRSEEPVSRMISNGLRESAIYKINNRVNLR